MASGQTSRSGSQNVVRLAVPRGLAATRVWWVGGAFASGSLAPEVACDVWQGDAEQADEGGVHTGFAALDAAFFHRGWPRAGLTELLCDSCGIGELRLLAPALAALCRNEARSIALVAPPFVPYPQALGGIGVDVGKILLIRPRNRYEALWAMEQALRIGACSAVLGWLSEKSLGFSNLRRLLLAARQGEAWGSLFRPAQAAKGASAAELRLHLSPGSGNCLRVNVIKRRGGWPLSGIELDVGAQADEGREGREGGEGGEGWEGWEDREGESESCGGKSASSGAASRVALPASCRTSHLEEKQPGSASPSCPFTAKGLSAKLDAASAKRLDRSDAVQAFANRRRT